MTDTPAASPPSDARSVSPRLWWALLAVTVVLRVPALVHPRAIDDETTYAVVALEMVEGGEPYLTAVERKPPLLFWVYASVIEASGKYNWFGLHVAALGWVFLTMGALFLVSRRLFDDRTALTAAFLYSLYQPWATWKNLAFNGEVLMNLPIALGMLLAFRVSPSRVRPDLVLSGALVGAAFLLKQPAAVAAVPLAVYFLLPGYQRTRRLPLRHGVLHAALFSFGFWALVGFVALVLVKKGIWREAFFWTITHHDVPHGVLDPVFWLRGGRMSLAFVGACAPLVIGAVLAVTRYRPLWKGREAEFAALVGLALVSVVGTAASGRFYPHYYVQLVLPLSVLAAPTVAGLLFRDPRAPWPLVSRRLLVTWLALTVVGFTAAHAVGLWQQRRPSDVGQYVFEHSDPHERIFVWGQAPGIYLDARRRPASRYVATFPLTGYIFGSPWSWDPAIDTSDRIVPGAWDRFAADVDRHPPVFIVDTEAVRPVTRYPMEQFPVLWRLVEKQYVMVYTGTDGIVYRRRDGLAVARSEPAIMLEGGPRSER